MKTPVTHETEPLPDFLAEPTRLGAEISITGRWVSVRPSGFFWASEESERMRQVLSCPSQWSRPSRRRA